jgi:hypothetical protein
MDKALVESLERLHVQLGQTETLDDESRQLLEHLQGDIRRVLDKPTASSRASLRGRLETAMTQLEDSHPQLTITIQEVLDHLANV